VYSVAVGDATLAGALRACAVTLAEVPVTACAKTYCVALAPLRSGPRSQLTSDGGVTRHPGAASSARFQLSVACTFVPVAAPPVFVNVTV